ncbi:hypothetical protein ZWY2020_052989 [Hordeum vulgare]|nr:hypothetical protein ZWY2020_052989 [Hordeum vulgare]
MVREIEKLLETLAKLLKDLQKKRPSRLTELDSKVNQLQDELKKTKEQLSASESRRRQAQHEDDEAKKQGQDASSKLEDSQCQLVELSAAKESRLQERRKIQHERDRTCVVQDPEAEVPAGGDSSPYSFYTASAKQREHADSRLEALEQEMELRLATIEGLKVNVNESDKAAANANAMATETKLQLETAKATIDSLLCEGDIELSKSNLKEAQAAGDEIQNEAQAGNANGGFGSPLNEVLKRALIPPVPGEQTGMTFETKTVYEMLEKVKSECRRQVCDIELKLKSKTNELMAAEMQPELEPKLMKSITDKAGLTANLMDKENALQSRRRRTRPSSRRPKEGGRHAAAGAGRADAARKKRPSRLTELDSKVNQLQDELKKTKEQVSASESRRRQAQHEDDEAKKQGQDASSKLEDSQCQLVELSAAKESCLHERRKIQHERDRTCAKQREHAHSKLEVLEQEMELRLATIEGLKECLRSKDIELSKSNLKEAQAAGDEIQNEAQAGNANGGFGSPLTEVLKRALIPPVT